MFHQSHVRYMYCCSVHFNYCTLGFSEERTPEPVAQFLNFIVLSTAQDSDSRLLLYSSATLYSAKVVFSNHNPTVGYDSISLLNLILCHFQATRQVTAASSIKKKKKDQTKKPVWRDLSAQFRSSKMSSACLYLASNSLPFIFFAPLCGVCILTCTTDCVRIPS